MTGLTRRQFTIGSAGALIAAGAPGSAGAQTPTRIKFTLDWKYQGIHSIVFWAQAKGYFAAEGLDVVIDQGTGSAATVSRIASGSYDAGLGDQNAIIQMAGGGTGEPPVMVYMLYSTPPFALITKASSEIKTLKDLQGKKMGMTTGSSAGALFPALAKLNGVDPATVAVVNVAPNLQEQMLLRGEVDFSAVFTVTTYGNLIGMKMDPAKDLRWFYFSDHGIDLYSNGLMVSRKLIAEKPAAVAGLVKAFNRAFKEVAADPKTAVAAMQAVEPLMDIAVETQRLTFALKTHFLSADTAANGVGDIRDDRMERAIKLMVETYKLAGTPKVTEVFDRSFLPPKADRMIAAAL